MPKDVEERLGKLSEYEAVWLGKGGAGGPAYVAVRKGGGFSMDLRGKYAKLKDEIKASGAPKVSRADTAIMYALANEECYRCSQ